MPDWLSYSISDFLPFSRDTYHRLVILYNARFSPAFAVGMGVGLVSLGLSFRPTAQRLRIVLAGFGLCWLWIGWAFHLQTLQPLLWAGELFALTFAVESGLLLAAAFMPAPLGEPAPPIQGRRIGYAMLAASNLLLPLIALSAGRIPAGLELVGTAPDPTAIATLALTALLPPTRAAILMPIPVLWCSLSSTMQYGLDNPLWWIPSAAAAFAILLLWGNIRAERS